MIVRAGEPPRQWHRSERFLYLDGNWFFITREGAYEGPFDTQDDAREGLDEYLREVYEDLFKGLH
ncbi:DUF6316 family protein [Marinobacteraceae bacterium S3BR75-40.1]